MEGLVAAVLSAEVISGAHPIGAEEILELAPPLGEAGGGRMGYDRHLGQRHADSFAYAPIRLM